MGPNPGAFGHQGAGGAIGFGDPENGVGFGYGMNLYSQGGEAYRRAPLVEATYAALEVLNVAAEPVVLRAWPETLHVERGGTSAAGRTRRRRRRARAASCGGKTVAGGPIMERLRSGLGDRLAAVSRRRAAAHAARDPFVAATALFARSGADVVVSVGGGSATDTGKAIALC